MFTEFAVLSNWFNTVNCSSVTTVTNSDVFMLIRWEKSFIFFAVVRVSDGHLNLSMSSSDTRFLMRMKPFSS